MRWKAHATLIDWPNSSRGLESPRHHEPARQFASPGDLAWSFPAFVCLVGGLSTMPKIEVNKVAEILKRNDISPAILRRVIEEMTLAVQPDPGEEEKPPAVKKQFVILVSDPDGKLPKHDFVGWVLQIPDTESVATTLDRIFRSS
jgi:hypothetical protein